MAMLVGFWIINERLSEIFDSLSVKEVYVQSIHQIKLKWIASLSAMS